MKIKAVEAILKGGKTFRIYKNDRCQWLGNGIAFYPLDDFPELTPDNIFSVFDIPQDKREKFRCEYDTFPDGINIKDVDENETLLERDIFDVIYYDRLLVPLKTSTGLIFVQKSLLKPFGKDDEYELYLREMPSGTPYVAVKRGWDVYGIIAPVLLNNDKFIKQAEDLLTFAKLRLENYKKENGDNAEEREETLI